jgi:hypothetical protein
MPQKIVSETNTGMCAFDQPGNIGDDKDLVADLHNAKVRAQGRKRIIGDLWACRADGRQEGGFSGIGEADQPYIGDQLELKVELEFFARLAKLGDARDLVGRGGKMGITQPAFASTRGEQALACSNKIDSIALALDLGMNNSAGRHFDHQVFAIAAVLARRAARATAARLEMLLVLKTQEGIELRIDFQEYIPASTAISTIGATTRHILFTPKRGEAITAIARFDCNMCAID